MKKLLALLLVLTLAVGSLALACPEDARDTIIIGVTNVIDKVDPTYGGNPWSLTATASPRPSTCRMRPARWSPTSPRTSFRWTT